MAGRFSFYARKPKTTSTSVTKHRTLLKDGSIPEKTIQAQILGWLNEVGLLHWRQNSGTVFFGGRTIHLGPDGLPDIVVVVPPGGRILGLEVKSSKGRQRPTQAAWQIECEAVGGYYRIVRSLEQAMDAVAAVLGEENWKLLQQSGSVKTLRTI